MLKGIFRFLMVMGLMLGLGLFLLYGNEIKTRLTQYQYLNEVETAMRKGHHKDVKRLLEEGVHQWPNEAMFHLRLAHYYHQTHQWEKAKEAYERGLDLHPTADAYRYNYARLLVQLREPNKAIQMYRMILNESPQHLGALVDLASVYRFAGNRADALGFNEERLMLWEWSRYYYSVALSMNPHSAKAWYGLSEVLQRDGQFEAASAGYCQAIRLVPSYTLAWFNLGLSEWYLEHEEHGMKLMNWAMQSYNRFHSQPLTEQSRTLHALRQTYFLVHKKHLRITHFDEAWIERIGDAHPKPPLKEEEFPPELLEACQGWRSVELNTKRPKLKAISMSRLNQALSHVQASEEQKLGEAQALHKTQVKSIQRL